MIVVQRSLFFLVHVTFLTNTNSLTEFDFDCGCKKTCTIKALNEVNGAPWSCGDRISFMMKVHDDPEPNACKMASKNPNLSDEENDMRPCRFEACNPDGGCRSNLVADPDPHPPLTCGCPETCNAEELAKIHPDQAFSCGERIGYFMHKWHLLEWDACEAAANQTACNITACDPITCGSNLTRVAKDLHKNLGPSPGLIYSLFLAVCMVLPTVFVLYRNKEKNQASSQNKGDSGDGVYRDNVELSGTSFKDSDAGSYKDDVPEPSEMHIPPDEALQQSHKGLGPDPLGSLERVRVQDEQLGQLT